MQLANYNVRSD